MLFRIGFFWFWIVMATAVYGQQLDSLLALLKQPLPDPQRVDILNEVAIEHYDFNDSLALEYAAEALRLALKINYLKGQKYAYVYIGLGKMSFGDYEEALKYYKACMALQVPQTEGIEIYCLMLIGNDYRARARYDSARFYYDASLQLQEKTGINKYAVTMYKNMAVMALQQFKNEEALQYLNKARSEYYKNHFGSLADVYSSLGKAYTNLLQYDKARLYYDSMCAVASHPKDYFHRIRCLLNQASLNYELSRYTEALAQCFEALDFTKKYAYPPQVVEINEKIGEIYVELSEYDFAGKYYYQALKIAEKVGLRYDIAILYNDLAWVYKEQGNYSLALEFVEKSEKICQQIDDQRGLATCHNIRGLVYMLQRKPDASLQEHTKALSIRKRINNIPGTAASIYNISLVYEQLGQFEKAISYQTEAIALEEKIGNQQSLGISYNSLGNLYLTIGDFKKASDYLNRAYAIAKKTGSKLLLRNNIGYQSALYEKKGDIKKALTLRKRYSELSDSVYSESAIAKTAEMQAIYQLEKKQQEIELLNQQQALQEIQIDLKNAQINRQRLLIGFGVALLVLLTVFAGSVFLYNQRVKRANREILEQKEEIQAQSEELTEANNMIQQINHGLEKKVQERTRELTQAYKELDTFFYRSSHDFRRPLTTFMGLAEVAKVTVKDQNALELFQKVRETAMNLDKMLLKLQSISDLGTQQLAYKEIHLKEIVDRAMLDFQYEIEVNEVKIKTKLDEIHSFYSYPTLLKIIIENILENTLHFCGDNPVTEIRAACQNDLLTIEIEDNGEGISEEVRDRIFDMYFRGSERSKGNGLGLYISRKAAEKLGGTIDYIPKQTPGALFRVTIPNGAKSAMA
jgi:signal transduction histidine kinase